MDQDRKSRLMTRLWPPSWRGRLSMLLGLGLMVEAPVVLVLPLLGRISFDQGIVLGGASVTVFGLLSLILVPGATDSALYGYLSIAFVGGGLVMWALPSLSADALVLLLFGGGMLCGLAGMGKRAWPFRLGPWSEH